MKSEELTVTLCQDGITQSITILYAERNCLLNFNSRPFNMKRHDLILSHSHNRWECDYPLTVLIFYDAIFDSLFLSQIADCRIIYDFIREKDSGSHDHLYFSTNRNRDLNALLHILRLETARRDAYTSKLIHLLSVGLFTFLDRSRPDELIVQNSTMIAKNRFGKLLKYMGDHFSTCSLKSAAEKFAYNPDYLSAMFKQVAGVSFSQKLLHIRLEEAGRLLQTTKYKVEEISTIVGFKDKSYFIHKFKERYGLSPAQWRKRHQTFHL